MENNVLTALLEIVKLDSPWQDSKNMEWETRDGALKDVIEAERKGLYNLPKVCFHLKRAFFEELWREKSKYGIVIIRGPRRIGKTSSLKYLVREMIKKGWNRESIFYITLDNEKLFGILQKKKILRELLTEIIRKNEDKKPLIIILDEVTFYKGWARALKNLVDNGDIGEGIGIITTGSYSLDLSTARSELPGRFGPLGENAGGEIFFPPRRFVEVAECLLPKDFIKEFSKDFGHVGKRMGFLEYFAGYQTKLQRILYGYENKANSFLDKYYDSLHALLERYMLTGGYPKAFFEGVLSEEKGELRVSDARYLDDIYKLFVGDSKKFGLSEKETANILSSILLPSMRISKDYSTLFEGLGVKKEQQKKYMKYFETSGLFSFLSSISSPEEIKPDARIVRPAGKKLKLIVNDPAAFFAFYFGSRDTSVFNNAQEFLKKEIIREHLFESIIVSHLKYIPSVMIHGSSNLGYILYSKGNEQEEEVVDGLVWYINHEGDFILLPVEVKYGNINKKQIENKIQELEKFNMKRLIVITNSNHIEIEERCVFVPAEFFLLLL